MSSLPNWIKISKNKRLTFINNTTGSLLVQGINQLCQVGLTQTAVAQTRGNTTNENKQKFYWKSVAKVVVAHSS